jgi:hypothetical protein
MWVAPVSQVSTQELV